MRLPGAWRVSIAHCRRYMQDANLKLVYVLYFSAGILLAHTSVRRCSLGIVVLFIVKIDIMRA